MKKKNLNFFIFPLLRAVPFVFMLPILDLHNALAWADASDIPGLPIARLALPSLSTDNDIVSSTGTPVGGKVIEFNMMIREAEARATLITQSTRALYDTTIAEVNEYHLIISEIEAKLQLGTTPGNPLLIALRNRGQEQLEHIMASLRKMDALSIQFSQNFEQMKSLSSKITETLQMPGAVDEDHAHLILMSDELEKDQRVITQALNILKANGARQNEWLKTERGHFAALALAIEKGKILPPQMGSVPSYPLPSPLPELGDNKIILPVVIAEPPVAAKPLLEAVQEELREERTETIPAPLSPTHSLYRAVAEEGPTRPLPVVAVESRPKAQPVELVIEEPVDENTALPNKDGPQLPLYAEVSKNREPFGIISNEQNVRFQKWYITSTAKRALKSPSDVLDIVNIVKTKQPNGRGDEVKDLLVDMGFNPAQLRVINAQAEDNQIAQVFLFAGK